jgi:hypothetical protein
VIRSSRQGLHGSLPASVVGYVPREGEEGIVVVYVALDTFPRASRLAVMLSGETHKDKPVESICTRWVWLEFAARSKPKSSMSVLGACRDIGRRVVAF